MPMYEYDCPNCGRLFEQRRSISESDSAVCPHCGSRYPKRRLSRINVTGVTNGGGSGGATFTLPSS